jgi:hypothetical protein
MLVGGSRAAGTCYYAKVNSDGSLNVAGSISASLAGFSPVATQVANLAVTTTSADVTLPTGPDYVVTNSGSSDVRFRIQIGAGTAVTTDQILKAGAATGIHVTTQTHLSAITASGSSSLNIQGGTGLAAGYGGGGSGGSASTVAIDQTTPGTTNGVYVTNNGVAQGTATSGQTPSTIACNTLTAVPTAYTTATTNVPSCDAYGNQVVQPYSLSASLVQGTTAAMTGTTSTSLVAAPGSGLRNYVTNLTCVNSHATVGTFVTVQDGSGGTALYTLAAAAVFGGSSIVFPAPLRQPTANTALYVADVTTGANVICSAAGYKAP